MSLLIVGSVAIALAAAVRSTWSPCGLSMLSTVTPVAERARGHRYGATATWFVVGATLGGATLAAGAALLAGLADAFDVSESAALTIAAVTAALATASDLRVLGFHLPLHTRQVNEEWLAKFRPWVYGAGFGGQIGVGFATYIMTGGIYLMVVLAALTRDPVVAFAVVTGFGFVRGLAVFLSARLDTPAKVFAFHRRFDAIGPWTRVAMIAVEGAVMGVATVAVAGPPALVPLALITAAAVSVSHERVPAAA